MFPLRIKIRQFPHGSTLQWHQPRKKMIANTENDTLDADLQETKLLFRRVVARDRKAIDELHARFSNLVFATVMQVLNNRQDAEDVMQEVFALLWKKADMYVEERGKPSTWLATLARNRAIDRFRSRDRRNRLNLGFEQETEMEKGWEAPSPSGAAEINELSSQARSAVLHLAPDQRLAIQLAFLEGLSQTEIAERTKTPLGTVKARIRRGLAKLRGLLKH